MREGVIGFGTHYSHVYFIVVSNIKKPSQFTSFLLKLEKKSLRCTFLVMKFKKSYVLSSKITLTRPSK